MKRFSGPITPSIESLLYRGDSPLFHDLKLIYGDVLNGDVTALQRVASVIQKHTKMDISVQAVDAPAPEMAIYFVHFDINHVLRDEGFQKMEGQVFNLATYKKLLDGGRGATDSHGAVSGVFTKIPATIIVTTPIINKELFTAEELAAGTLHEVGHLYGYFDALGRTLATSMLLQETQQQLAKTVDLGQRQQIVDETIKLLDFDGVDTVELAKLGQEPTFELVCVRNTVARILSDMGDAKLFGSEVEFLADSYAVRSGAAKPLTSLYIKLARANRHIQTVSRMEYVLTEAFKAALLIAGTFNPITVPITGLAAGLAIAAAAPKAADRNNPIERLEAVHADLVSALKDVTLPKELKESLVQDVQFISGLREQLVKRSTIVTKLWQTLSPSHRRTIKQIKLQQEIGKLVNNDLFPKVAQLSTLEPSA